MFLTMLAFFSVATSVFTEAVKMFLDSINKKYVSNVVVLCVSVLVAGLGMGAFYILNDFSFSALNIISIFLMICANWLCAMVGYDKIKQILNQYKK